MRLGHRHVQLRRGLLGIARRVLDHEAFLAAVRAGALAIKVAFARGDGQDLQTEIAPDAVLQVNHVIALLELREINVQRRARGLRVRRFEPARTLHLVTPEYFRVGHDDQFGFLVNKSATERAQMHQEPGIAIKSVIFPDFLEPLPLAVVVAKNMDGKALTRPPVKLREKFATLRFGNLRLGSTRTKRTEGVEGRECKCGVRNAERGIRERKDSGCARLSVSFILRTRQLHRLFIFRGRNLKRIRRFKYTQGGHSLFCQLLLKFLPGNEKRIVLGNLLGIFIAHARRFFPVRKSERWSRAADNPAASPAPVELLPAALFQDPQLTARWQRNRRNLVPRNLRHAGRNDAVIPVHRRKIPIAPATGWSSDKRPKCRRARRFRPSA